jgi:hypothetical protein
MTECHPIAEHGRAPTATLTKLRAKKRKKLLGSGTSPQEAVKTLGISVPTLYGRLRIFEKLSPASRSLSLNGHQLV